MKIILLTIIGALILLWGGIWVLLKWIAVSPQRKNETTEAKWISHKHLLGLGAYISAISGILIFLVIQTTIIQQETTRQLTQSRLSQELDAFRERLEEIQDKLMGQVEEKAELTQSEWKVRGDLQTERATHKRTQDELRNTQASLVQETTAHNAYSDSLQIERTLRNSDQNKLDLEKQLHQETQENLDKIKADLIKTTERLEIQEDQILKLQNNLKETNTHLNLALNNASVVKEQLVQRNKLQQQDLDLLKASVDSIHQKVIQRFRIPSSNPK